MLDHVILTVSNVERSLAFYEAALKPLNIRFFMPYKGENGHPDLWGFGDGKKACFWLKQGTPDPGSVHWGFKANNNAQVDKFYRAAIRAGAKDNISPRARVEYYPGSIYGPAIVSEFSKHASGSHPCRVVLLVTSKWGDVTAEAAVDGFSELAMNFAPHCCCAWKHGLNPRSPPTIRVSLTTSQVLRRPPEVT